MRISHVVRACLLVVATAGIAAADAWTGFAADGSLDGDWGIDLSTQSGESQYSYGLSANGAWSTAGSNEDLKPTNLTADSYDYEVKDDDVPTYHGGEGFDVEAMYMARDSDYFYFAILTSAPPDGARDPYRSHQTQDYDDDSNTPSSRRRFFPGDLALSIEAPHPTEENATANYEFGLVVADPDPKPWNYPTAHVFADKHAGDVWYKDPELSWFTPDHDRSADITGFSNFRTDQEGSTEVYDGNDKGNTSYSLYGSDTFGSEKGDELTYDAVQHSGSYGDLATELYYGPAQDALPPDSFEGPGDGVGADGAYYPEIGYSWSEEKWVYKNDSPSDIRMDTYLLEAKYPKALFFDQITNLSVDGSYHMHWTMGCTNDALGFHVTLTSTYSDTVIPEPVSVAFLATAFGLVVGARQRLRRRERKRS